MSTIYFRFALSFAILATSVLDIFVAGICSAALGGEPRLRVQALERAIQVRKQNTNRFLTQRDVVGMAVGIAPDGKFAVKVYTKRPEIAGIPKSLDGVPVVAEAVGEFYALRRPTPRRRPGPRRGPMSRDLRPLVSIADPKDGEFVSGDATISAYAFDDEGVVLVDFYLNDAPLGSDEDGYDGWSVVWDTTQVEDGPYTLTATAIDTIGQEASDSVTVMVDNEPGPFSPNGRPTPIGVSTGNENECSAGTIACRVKDAKGNVYALSNNHVYARTNQAKIGETILQPGLFDTDYTLMYSDQVIGLLSDYVPLDFRWRGNNTIDAAIAISSTEDLGTSTPSDGYGTPKSVPVAAYVDQPVQKYGRTTLLTTGYVSGIDATVAVTYDNRTANFTGQIIVNGEAFIDAGDSGSLLVTYDPDQPNQGGRDPVGLLFAGNEDGSVAIANPIQPVLDAFGVTIDGE